MLKKICIVSLLIIFAAIVIHDPKAVSDPGASPRDPAREDLTRIAYPSMEKIKWKPYFMKPQDSLERLFGGDWEYVARFNRVDRRHAYPGMTIRVPVDMNEIRAYTPMPAFYQPAKRYDKYILVDITEQWLGAYENGTLKFSMPAASGTMGHETPTGVFRVDARHREHTSSLYKTEDEQAQYPMDYAFRFHVGKDNVAYWIHARDLPGKPASHGCIGVYDESMQNRMYGIPRQPVLQDSRKLYDWAVGENDYEGDSGELELLENGPIVEVIGSIPGCSATPFESFTASSNRFKELITGLRGLFSNSI
ncbi:MAG: ErfK/YbiS/YcfS/YnhG family protein [Geobacteraceae bacterium]|nr:ErfK/YbiS/YcfS/YnhG family protein [Geobacteraceae bacterium]